MAALDFSSLGMGDCGDCEVSEIKHSLKEVTPKSCFGKCAFSGHFFQCFVFKLRCNTGKRKRVADTRGLGSTFFSRVTDTVHRRCW